MPHEKTRSPAKSVAPKKSPQATRGKTRRHLELLFLGGFDIRFDGQSLANHCYSRMRALLAYLALDERPAHSRESLAELLWSGSDPVTARGNLRRTLADLRRVLEHATGVALFAATRDSISFVANAAIDAVDFNRPLPAFDGITERELEEENRLLALYRGEFLAGFSLPDSPVFESWLQGRREALHRRILAMLERLANVCEQRGACDKALQYAQRHAELEPWNEDVQRHVIRLYVRNGQSGAALAQFEAYRRLLKTDLGVQPGEETMRLVDSVRRSERRPDSAGGAGGAALIPPAAPVPVPMLPQTSTERRQVSVLYCELALPDVDDPEVMLAALQAPQAQCTEIVRQFSGHLVQAYGGGLLAYFGYPRADEHAARHAVQAGLAAIARVSAAGLEIRIGIHTGLVVADMASGQPDTAGRTTRQAILLRSHAGHDSVAISRATYDIVAGYFDCGALETVVMPGFGRAIEIFHVQRESGAQTRLEAAARLTPLVGRHDEVARLLAAWESATRGQGQTVLLRGEAGIGKTRLLHTLKERLAGRDHVLRELRCFPETSQSPFYPLIAMLEANLGFISGDTPAVRRHKLAAYLHSHYADLAAEALPLMAALLSLSSAEDGEVMREASPKKLKERTLAILMHFLQTLTLTQPVLLIVEDLHWIDPSTLELLGLLVRAGDSMAILALFTARPEFADPWRNTRKITLTLNPLADSEIAAMIDSLGERIAATTVRHIVERADGIPLFAEEMTKIAAGDKAAQVPATLLDLLMARMDSMGEAKRTAQIAATLGREFNLTMLRRIAADPAMLGAHLESLQNAGLILPAKNLQQQFKHALIQEVAYQSQSLADRQAAHRRIAAMLQAEFPEIVAHQPELLARHQAGAGDTESAIASWLAAGQQAASHSANPEAITHFKAALELLASLPEDQERNNREFGILVSLFPVLYATAGYGAQEAVNTNARIAALSRIVSDTPDLFPAKWTVCVNSIGANGPRGIREAVAPLLGAAQDDPIRLQAACYLGANACFWQGDFATSAAYHERSDRLYHSGQTPQLIAQYGSDLSVFSASHGMFARFMLGYADQAQAICEQSIQRARAGGHTHTLAQALGFAATLQRWMNKTETALALADEAIAISREQDFPLWLASAQMNSGWARVVLGQHATGLAEMAESIAGMRAAIGGISVVFLAARVHTLMHLERHADALDTLAEAFADAERNGDGHYLAELHRLQAECLLALGPGHQQKAEILLNKALDIARGQQALQLELRAATSLARLWQKQRKKKAARQLLATVHGRFTEGFSSHDMREAVSLLRSLA